MAGVNIKASDDLNNVGDENEITALMIDKRRGFDVHVIRDETGETSLLPVLEAISEKLDTMIQYLEIIAGGRL